MMDLLVVKLVVLALAVFRGAALLTQDKGPWNAFLRLRVHAGVYDRDISGNVTGFWAALFECPYCMGIWLALPAVVVLAVVPFPTEFPRDSASAVFAAIWAFTLWIGLAGAQAVLERIAGRSQ